MSASVIIQRGRCGFQDVPVNVKLEEEQKYELIVIILTFFRTLQKIKVGFRSHKKGKIPKT